MLVIGISILQGVQQRPGDQGKAMKTLMAIVCLGCSMHAFAECTTTAMGRKVCNNGQAAAGYNSNRGTAWTANKNQNGVTTAQTSNGGKSKSKNGKGVYTSPSGKTCVRTATNQGCN
jgi:hypothetical protein